MANTRAALTDEDLRTLVKGATPDERAVAAHKLCRTIEAAELDPEERERAHDILRVMATDAAELVRRAVAVTLKNSPALPRDVALKLARDVDGVALPILSFSPAFTDEDLAEIIRLGEPIRQVAVAKRPVLSATVTDVIAEVGVERAVEAACANDNAHFAERSLQKVIDRFEQSERVLSAMAYRNTLPLAVTEKLVELVSEKVLDHLVSAHALSPDLALQIALGAKERATIDLVDQAGRAADMRSFVAHLNKHERLTASLLLRALVHGHMTFFEWSLAELASIPHHRTWLMIHDAGPLGLRAIYERAGLPARLLPAFRAGVDAYHSMSFDGSAGERKRFQEHLMQRFLTQPHTAVREDVEYLLEKMDRVAAEARRPASARNAA
ncbi:MAG: DUF2336 domain-containing protein [Phenylobacterium sp.]|uniref:DUF2336 domain-containing protein n=1 Tax=Phenylobacterium sp. TaxID=1871053 RepID=UPI0027328D04|nr:DUF2336 domain-containing protein [Phenylobacterium sp.]MDP3173918.1 DUF2336 domain-containing protein [Phenylobacterium sp.]